MNMPKNALTRQLRNASVLDSSKRTTYDMEVAARLRAIYRAATARLVKAVNRLIYITRAYKRNVIATTFYVGGNRPDSPLRSRFNRGR